MNIKLIKIKECKSLKKSYQKKKVNSDCQTNGAGQYFQGKGESQEVFDIINVLY